MTEQEAQLHVESGTWLTSEADKLIEQYKACKTAHDRWLLLPKMSHLVSRMSFECNEIKKSQEI